MLKLSNFFQKFKNIEKDKEERLLEIIQAVREGCGVLLSPQEVVVESEAVRIASSPLKRNNIFMYKEKILESLKSRGLKIKEIR